jgi:hypothetical protein
MEMGLRIKRRPAQAESVLGTPAICMEV